jgi:hypothetical protein
MCLHTHLCNKDAFLEIKKDKQNFLRACYSYFHILHPSLLDFAWDWSDCWRHVIYTLTYRVIVCSTSSTSSISFFFFLSPLVSLVFFLYFSFSFWETKKNGNHQAQRQLHIGPLTPLSMFHRDHFLSSVRAPIVQKYLSLTYERHRSSPILVILLFKTRYNYYYYYNSTVRFLTCRHSLKKTSSLINQLYRENRNIKIEWLRLIWLYNLDICMQAYICSILPNWISSMHYQELTMQAKWTLYITFFACSNERIPYWTAISVKKFLHAYPRLADYSSSSW